MLLLLQQQKVLHMALSVRTEQSNPITNLSCYHDQCISNAMMYQPEPSTNVSAIPAVAATACMAEQALSKSAYGVKKSHFMERCRSCESASPQLQYCARLTFTLPTVTGLWECSLSTACTLKKYSLDAKWLPSLYKVDTCRFAGGRMRQSSAWTEPKS